MIKPADSKSVENRSFAGPLGDPVCESCARFWRRNAAPVLANTKSSVGNVPTNVASMMIS